MESLASTFLEPTHGEARQGPAVSLVPALRDAQEAAREAASTRREEDVAVEKGVKEVLAWASTHRPKNTSRNYLPKQREWRASSTFILVPSIWLYFIVMLTQESFTGVVRENEFSPWWGVSPI